MLKKQLALIVALALVASTAFASIFGTHTWTSTDAPDMTVANLGYNQTFVPPSNPPIGATTHTITGVSWNWDVYVCGGTFVPPVSGTTVGSNCMLVPNPAGLGVYVEVCRLNPGSSFPTCGNITSAKTGSTSMYNGETYTSSATKFFLRYRVQMLPIGLNGHVYVSSGAKVNVGFQAF
jgi:hypothetical protein